MKVIYIHNSRSIKWASRMDGKAIGIIVGFVLILAGALLLAMAWVSSTIYGFKVDAVVYSPWLDWGLIIVGIIIIIAVLILGR